MQSSEPYTVVKVYDISDTNPDPISIDGRVNSVIVTVDPLQITNPPLVLTSTLHTEDNYQDTGAEGKVTIHLKPPNSFRKYVVPESVIYLDDITFMTTNIPITSITPVFENITGCTHIAVGITGQQE